MRDNRFNGVALMCVHKKKKIGEMVVKDKFAKAKPWTIELVGWSVEWSSGNK